MYRIGNLLRHEIYVSWTALLLALFYVISQTRHGGDPSFGLLLAGVTFFSILIHELGHAVVATRLGYGPCQIVLHGFGGVAIHRAAPGNKSIWISLAGPGAGFFFGVFLYVLKVYVFKELSPVQTVLLYWALYINIIWSIVNLLPIYPLDGGMIGHVLFRKIYGNRVAHKATAVFSLLVLGVALFYAWKYGYSVNNPFLIFLVVNLFLQNLSLYQGRGSSGLGGY